MPIFGELQAATSLRGLVPQVFASLASASALVVIGAAVARIRPTGMVAEGLQWLGLSVPSHLAAVTRWLAVRADVMTVATVAAMVFALLWSGAFLFRDRSSWDRARGPSTYWIGLTVVTEIHGTATALGTVVVTVLALTFIGVSSAARARRTNPDGPQTGPAGDAAGAVGGGLVLVPFYLPFVILNGLGGLPRRRSVRESAESSGVKETSTPGANP